MSEPIVLSEWREKRANSTASPSPSTLNTTSDEHGQTSIDDDEILAVLKVYSVVAKARMQPFTTKSDFARMAANEVALAASEGFISTRVNESQYCNMWMVTYEGLAFLESVEETVEFDDVPSS